MEQTKLLADDVIPLSVVPKLLPRNADGKTVNMSTLWRWHRYGLGGVRLEIQKVGGRVFTTRSALRRFIAARSSPPSSVPPATPGPRNEDVERRLDALGIKA
jgi:hypothetical protein